MEADAVALPKQDAARQGLLIARHATGGFYPRDERPRRPQATSPKWRDLAEP